MRTPGIGRLSVSIAFLQQAGHCCRRLFTSSATRGNLMNIEKENQGEGAPLIAPNEEGQPDLIENEERNSQDQADVDQCIQLDQPMIVIDEENYENMEESSKKEGDNQDTDNKSEGNENSEDQKEKLPRLSGAARKRFRYYIEQGYSREEAREKSLLPLSASKRSSSPSSNNPKRSREERGIKICIVHTNFPEELLTTEQLTAIQESITDKILEMGQESSTKPKFYSSTPLKGFISFICTNKLTADWLKDIMSTLKPWEGASLKALEDDDMPHPETFSAFLPDSQDYSNEKILKLLEAQNDTFNVSSWKVLKREVVGSQLELTFSIDRKIAMLIRKANHKVSYKFGHIELWAKDKKKPPSKFSDSRPRSETRRSPPPRPSRGRGPPPRSPRGYKGSGSEWRGSHRRGLGGGYRSSMAPHSRASDSHRPSPWEWSREDSPPRATSNYGNGQGNSWYAGTWKPWKM